MGRLPLHAFLLPGNAAFSALGITGEEDRMTVRTLVDIPVWNPAAIVGTVLLFD